MATKVVVSRKWSNPEIELKVDREGIQISMDLDDFVAALADEAAEPLAARILSGLGSPTTWIGRARLEKEFSAAIEGVEARSIFRGAAERIVREMKGFSRSAL